MKKVYIKLDGMQKVNEFVSMLQQHKGEFDLQSGRYIVDAKSILGIFSLDLSDYLELTIYEEDETIMDNLRPFFSR